MKTYFLGFIGFSVIFLLFNGCKTPGGVHQPLVTQQDSANVGDTSPVVLQPDPFSQFVELETKYGSMKIELFFEVPNHRENFLKLVDQQYYDSLLFHRVIKSFMVQGGDPTSRNAGPKQRLGANGPGYELDAEITDRYYHIKGALAAARQPDQVNPDKKSSGSQFYIVHGSKVTDEMLDKYEREQGIIYSPKQRNLYKRLGGAPQLDRNYTVFGRVYEGLDIIDSIANQMTNNMDRPTKDVKMAIRRLEE